MTDAEVITLSEITQQPISDVESAVSGISDALETKLQAEISEWNTNRNDVDMKIDADGVRLETQWLLDKITERVCTWLGFPLPSDKFYSQLPGSMVVSTTLGW